MNIRVLFISLVLLLSSFASALTIKSNAPTTYTVVKGDTLWDISGMYLNEPWRWGEIWRSNPQIKNPHLIYPGDVISFQNGRLSITRSKGGMRHVKLTPEMKEVPIDLGIPVVSYNKIKSSLLHIKVVTDAEVKALPYIIAAENNRLIALQNQRVYINKPLKTGVTYDVYERGETHKATRGAQNRKGKSRTVELGTEIIKVGEVVIERIDPSGETSTGIVKSLNRRGINPGNWLVEKPAAGVDFFFEPKPAPHGVAAEIINLPNAFQNASKRYTVVLDRGMDAGLERGHTLLVQSDEKYVNDPHTGEKVKLPSEALGTIMIYEVFDQTSLGLVMDAKDRIKLGNMAVTPFSGKYAK